MSDKRTMRVGKEIFNILSESLYSNPIHLFREYIQNSIDSISKKGINYQGRIQILVLKSDGSLQNDLSKIDITSKYHLLFVDDGCGYDGEIDDMITDMAISGKNERDFIGYKGIGRFSGFSFCDEITFVNNKTKLEKITVDVNSIRDDTNDKEFFIDDHLIEVENEHLFVKHSDDAKFMVLLTNLSRTLKIMIKDPSFKNRLATQLKCKNDVVTYNKTVEKFLKNQNMTINYKLFLNKKEVKRLYSTKKNMEQDAIIDILPTREDVVSSNDYFGAQVEEEEVLARAILKIGHKINYTYRKENDLIYGMRIYHKGMLVTSGEDIIAKVHSLYPLRKTPGEFASMIRSFYVEIHIESRDILLNSARDWVSFIVNKDYKENRAAYFILGLHSLINKLDSLRYDFSKYYSLIRKKDTRNERVQYLQKKLEDNLVTMSNNIAINSKMIDNYIQKEVSSSVVITKPDYDDFMISVNAVFKITNCKKIEEVILELKRLRISVYKNACSMMFRSFIELTLKYFDRIEDDFSYIDQNLSGSLIRANNLLFGASNSRDIQLIHRSINRLIKSQECVTFLNGAVHNIDSLVNVVELKAIRDTLNPLIKKIYS